MVSALCMPLLVSCGSLRNGNDDNGDESSAPPKLSERISNVDYNKEFDKKSLDVSKSFSGTSTKEFGQSNFQGKRTEKLKTVSGEGFATGRYNTERFQSTGTEQKKPRFSFLGDRVKKQKTSSLADRRSRDDRSARYSTEKFSDRTNIDALIGNRSERDISDRVISREYEGTGNPSPTIIRQSTQSEGDIRALLNGPL